MVWSLRRNSSQNVISHPAFSAFVLRNSPHEWMESVGKKLDELCSLPIGWDGYSAPPVSFSTAHFAMNILAVCPPGTPAPQIVPGSNGDLQIEWHTLDSDVELHVRRPNDVFAWRMSPVTSAEGEEAELTTDFNVVAAWLGALAETSVAPNSSAA
jgi:hypothetical protein